MQSAARANRIIDSSSAEFPRRYVFGIKQRVCNHSRFKSGLLPLDRKAKEEDDNLSKIAGAVVEAPRNERLHIGDGDRRQRYIHCRATLTSGTDEERPQHYLKWEVHRSFLLDERYFRRLESPKAGAPNAEPSARYGPAVPCFKRGTMCMYVECSGSPSLDAPLVRLGTI